MVSQSVWLSYIRLSWEAMTLTLLVKGGRVVNPAVNQDEICDILVENGKIKAIAQESSSRWSGKYMISGLVVAPGFIDMHVHLRQPGQSAKETVITGTQAAAAGGITRVATMPNTNPVIDKAILVEGMKYKAEHEERRQSKSHRAISRTGRQRIVCYGWHGQAGVVAFSDDGRFVEDSDFMRKAMEYASMFHKIIIDHCEETSLVAGGQMHEGVVSAELGLKGRPAAAEDIAVARDIILSEITDTPVHIAHISTKHAVDMVRRRAKARGLKITAEATPQHMILTDEALRTYDPRFKVNPPLRSEEHRSAVVEGLKDGTIDAIVTDHAPHTWDEKDQEFSLAPSGFVGLETSVGAVLTHLYHTGAVDLMTIIRAMSTAPARLLGVDAGVIAEGKDADLTIIDLDKEWTVEASSFYSKRKISPFDEMILQAKPWLQL